MKLSIIVPVYNEEKTIGEVLDKLIALKLPWQKEIVVVDDGSTDGTRSQISKFKTSTFAKATADKQIYNSNLKTLFIKINKGKGTAVRLGIKQATGDYILIHDADMEYNPDEIHKLLSVILARRATSWYPSCPESPRDPGRALPKKSGSLTRMTKPIAVYGSRFIYKNVSIPKAYYFGNKFLTWLTNIFYGTNLTDMETCYKLIPNNLEWHKLTCKGFDIEPEITINLIKNKIPIIEVPIRYSSRSRSAGKKLTLRDAFSAIKVIAGKYFQ